jgi:superfamily II DNA or RNA helicase
MPLRYYQVEQVDSVLRAFERSRSVLGCAATGTGKSTTLSEISYRFAAQMRRVLILAHREELLSQIASRLEEMHGIRSAIEKAERAEAHDIMPTLLETGAPGVGPDGKPLVVVASVQSMVRRLDKFKPDHFDLVVVDECHHAAARTYRDIIDHFAGAKVFGTTATADRGDRVALGEVFDEVAFNYDMPAAIEDGWLVPIHQQTVETQHLDLTKVRTVGGDFNLGDLETAMTQTDLLHEIAGPFVEIAGDRQFMMFAVTVEHAYLLAEAVREQIADRWRNLGRGDPPVNIVVGLDGTSTSEERAAALEGFRRGAIQGLCNAQLLTEGVDLPAATVLGMCRPTKSRAFYQQAVGRVSRPLPGVVDAFPERGHSTERRSAIALSGKPAALVVDFAGNAGKHKLIGPLDLLGGDYSEPEISMAKGMLKRHEVKDILEALRRARAKILEMEALRAQARKGYTAVTVDPFDPFDVLGVEKGSASGARINERQRRALKEYGVESVDRLDVVQANSLLKTINDRKAAGLCDFKQIRTLMRRGKVKADRAVGLSHAEAATLIAKLAKNNWTRPPSWDLRFGPPAAME